MGHVVNLACIVPRLNANHFDGRESFEFLGSGRTYEDLRGGQQSGKVDEFAEGGNLCNRLERSFTEDG
jgi:hypothetical protein